MIFMKKLTSILARVTKIRQQGNCDIPVSSIVFDSRACKPGDLFVAVKGTQVDGHKYISMAIENGAVAVVCEQMPDAVPASVVFVQVADSSVALGEMAAAFYDYPSEKLKVVGVTGTNGKTTTATLLYQAVRKLGYACGLLSTVRNYIDNQSVEATHTTPDSVAIQALLAQMVDAGCEYCFMEVSSHAIHQSRIQGIEFKGGIFTNISRDHLDYHPTFRDYIEAKQTFFTQLPKTAFALTNADDKNGDIMVQKSQAQVLRYGVKNFADYKARIVETHFEGTQLIVDNADVWTFFVGIFNVYNLLSVYSTLCLLGFEKEEVLRTLSMLKPVEGRFETIRSEKGITAIVDYAHTPDALENVLTAINEIRESSQQVITVVGAGGNRDKGKRPEMARIAAGNSHRVILTSDNPRFEKPETIIEDMKKGLEQEGQGKTLAITDRREAMRTAIMLAQPGDVVLVAGKGHETYQEVEGVKHHFDDRETVRNIFEEIN